MKFQKNLFEIVIWSMLEKYQREEISQICQNKRQNKHPILVVIFFVTGGKTIK